MKLDEGKLNIGMGAQFGSESKGLLSNYVATTNHIDIAISDASSNAGHTGYIYGKKCVLKHLPMAGIVSDRCQIYLCSGAIINPKILLQEIKTYDVDPNRIAIHPRCAIITQSDIDSETARSSQMTSISSTQSGVGSALARKVSRTAKLAKDIPELSSMISELDIQSYMDDGCTAYMEVPQGLDLSLSSSQFYPFCTSRDITVASAINDAQVHPSYLGKVAVCLRTFPIRVGNLMVDGIEVGQSGAFYPDSVETSWGDIGVEAELTTVTSRVRRVASFSMMQYERMLKLIKPDYILLTFANYMTKEALANLLNKLPEVTHLSFSPTIDTVYLNHGHF